MISCCRALRGQYIFDLNKAESGGGRSPYCRNAFAAAAWFSRGKGGIRPVARAWQNKRIL